MGNVIEEIDVSFAKLRVEKTVNCVAQNMRMQKRTDIQFTTYFKHLSGSPHILSFDTEWYEVDNERILEAVFNLTQSL